MVERRRYPADEIRQMRASQKRPDGSEIPLKPGTPETSLMQKNVDRRKLLKLGGAAIATYLGWSVYEGSKNHTPSNSGPIAARPTPTEDPIYAFNRSETSLELHVVYLPDGHPLYDTVVTVPAGKNDKEKQEMEERKQKINIRENPATISSEGKVKILVEIDQGAQIHNVEVLTGFAPGSVNDRSSWGAFNLSDVEGELYDTDGNPLSPEERAKLADQTGYIWGAYLKNAYSETA